MRRPSFVNFEHFISVLQRPYFRLWVDVLISFLVIWDVTEDGTSSRDRSLGRGRECFFSSCLFARARGVLFCNSSKYFLIAKRMQIMFADSISLKIVTMDSVLTLRWMLSSSLLCGGAWLDDGGARNNWVSNFSLFVKNPKHSFGPNIRSFGFLSYFQVLLNLVSNNLAGSVQRSQLLGVLGIEVVILCATCIFLSCS